jgi:hypothetical protein
LDGWLGLLEQSLPPHLRLQTTPPSDVKLDSTDTAQIILSAQYPPNPSIAGFDLLHNLGLIQGRWVAVMWLVKELTEDYHQYTENSARLAHLAHEWPLSKPLAELTLKPIELSRQFNDALPQPTVFTGLNDLCYLPSKNNNLAKRLRHAAVGQIWRSIGRMTQACAGAAIAPEVLEVIAHLHHKEIMPTSIYQFEPNVDNLAIRMPPLLSLLSSRILTSLSDAAWRAHEKLIIQDAKSKGDAYAALRPEIPSSVYRVHVAGLKPELWMELILWSCLRGGWVQEGVQILLSLSADRSWKPISWQEHVSKFSSKAAKASMPEWNEWDFQFKTRSPDTMDAPIAAEFHVDRTISGEVVSAFADALVGLVDVGVGNRGIPMRTLVASLRELQRFLNVSRLSLTTGSWDALLLRLADTHIVDARFDGAVIQEIVSLSPGMSRRLPSTVKQMESSTLPNYVLDGNLAMQGLLHTALKGQIGTGHFESALQVFNIILERADEDKRDSITSFLRRRKSLMDTAIRKGHFTSNFSGIDYPALNVQIPAFVLAALLDLATEARSYDFGNWLIASEDVDGPLITLPMYGDVHIQPALLNFALETNNEKLAETVLKQSSSNVNMQTFFNSRVSTLQWGAATTLLELLVKSGRDDVWNAENLANLGRVIISLAADPKHGSSKSESSLAKAEGLFTAMVLGKYDGAGARKPAKIREVQSIISVLSTVTRRMGKFCLSIGLPPRQLRFKMTSANFNLMLEGIVETHGSIAGRRVLATFWPWQARLPINNSTAFGTRQSTSMQTERPRALRRLLAHSLRISVGNRSKRSGDTRSTGKSTSIQGTVVPNTRTVLIILQRALEELGQQSHESKPQTSGMTSSLAPESIFPQAGNVASLAMASSSNPSPASVDDAGHRIDASDEDLNIDTDKSPETDHFDRDLRDSSVSDAEIAAGIAADEGVPVVDISARGMVAWAVRHLTELPSVEENLVRHLDFILRQYGLEEIRADLSRIVRQVQRTMERSREEEDDDEVHCAEEVASAPHQRENNASRLKGPHR